MTVLAKIPVRMSVEEFLAWEPGDGRAWQGALRLDSIGFAVPLADVYARTRLCRASGE